MGSGGFGWVRLGSGAFEWHGLRWFRVGSGGFRAKSGGFGVGLMSFRWIRVSSGGFGWFLFLVSTVVLKHSNGARTCTREKIFPGMSHGDGTYALRSHKLSHLQNFGRTGALILQ